MDDEVFSVWKAAGKTDACSWRREGTWLVLGGRVGVQFT